MGSPNIGPRIIGNLDQSPYETKTTQLLSQRTMLDSLSHTKKGVQTTVIFKLCFKEFDVRWEKGEKPQAPVLGWGCGFRGSTGELRTGT